MVTSGEEKMRLFFPITRLLQLTDTLRLRIVIWLYVIFTRCALSCIVVSTLSALLFLVPQANEALFGMLAPLATPGELSRFAIGGFGRFAFVSIALLLGISVWYGARMLCTVDAHDTPLNAIDIEAFDKEQSIAIEWVPRWLGTLSVAAIFGSGVLAMLATDAIRWYSALATFGMPIAFAVVTQCVVMQRRLNLATLAWILCAPSLAALSALQLRAEARTFWSLGMVVMLLLLPSVLLWFFIRRRAWLHWASVRWGNGFVADSGPVQPRALGQVWGRLVLCATASFSVLFAFALLPPNVTRLIGSVNVVLLFLMAVALAGAAIVIATRRLVFGAPILGLVFGTIAVAILFFREEPIGREKLLANRIPPQRLIAASNAGVKNIVVNARGGGLRAAVYTAGVLADLDDQSCGRFGDRLAVMSGVSGGALGIATYLLARQHLIASHHWDSCPPAPAKGLSLKSIVETALLQDHLSPVLAHMLSEDLWPLNRPSRGQALLDSWESSLQTAIPGATTTLAMPISMLDGGIAGGVDVYFNATDARSGTPVWFSNTGSGTVQFGGDRPPVPAMLSIGEAVLHSARFPIVSPAGAFPVSAPNSPMYEREHLPTLNLVDGGYVDNSGASTLAFGHQTESQIWLDLDGNPDKNECNVVSESKAWIHWTGVGALLAARSAQADAAVSRLEKSQYHPHPISLKLSLKKALESTITGDAALCRAVSQRRSAPLGWYFAVITAKQMYPAITKATSTVCGELTGLCEHL